MVKPISITDQPDGSAPAATDKPCTRTRPSAILIKVGAEEFPEVARRIGGGASPEVIGDSVVGM